MTFAVFHDFPGLANRPPKFHDVPGPVGTPWDRPNFYGMWLTQKYMLDQDAKMSGPTLFHLNAQ